jgi:hypothetical protein
MKIDQANELKGRCGGIDGERASKGRAFNIDYTPMGLPIFVVSEHGSSKNDDGT